MAILNEYLTEMTNIIIRWDGTLDQIVGDMIVAFWGAPLRQPNHAELAIKCTLHMKQRLAELREVWLREGRVPLDAGFGLNTGEVVVGNIGAEGKKMDLPHRRQRESGSRVEDLPVSTAHRSLSPKRHSTGAGPCRPNRSVTF